METFSQLHHNWLVAIFQRGLHFENNFIIRLIFINLKNKLTTFFFASPIVNISMNFAIWSAWGESPTPYHSMSLQGIATSKIKKFSHICLSVRGHHHQVLKNISSYPIPECIGHVLTTSFPSTISLISSMSRVSYFISPSASFVTFSLFFISTFFVLLYDSCKLKK